MLFKKVLVLKHVVYLVHNNTTYPAEKTVDGLVLACHPLHRPNIKLTDIQRVGVFFG